VTAIDNLISEIERSYADLTAKIVDPEVIGDRARYADAARSHAELAPVHELAAQYRAAERTVADAEGLLGDDSSDAEMRAFAQAELLDSRRRMDELGEEIRVRMLARDPNDAKDVIIEIRAGTGGNEACIFAADLARMYTRYAQSKGYEVELLSANENDDGGYKEVTVGVKGQGAFSLLKYEGGVHRVQRVPVTEAVGRIHTSTATVAVLPEAEDIEVDVQAGDLRIDIFRARGPGGQSVNTTDSAVRITHVPSGVSVSCQDEKSQFQNKEKAMRILRARLFELEQARQDEERGAVRRSMVGSGERSQKIRTYNFPQNRVTDHRVGLTSHRIDGVMEGELDEFTEALAAEDRRQQLALAGGE
jgi:peptide chain release factor 1